MCICPLSLKFSSTAIPFSHTSGKIVFFSDYTDIKGIANLI